MSQGPKGTPLSRAKAYSCLDAVALFVRLQAIETTIIIDAIAVAAALDWVTL